MSKRLAKRTLKAERFDAVIETVLNLKSGNKIIWNAKQIQELASQEKS